MTDDHWKCACLLADVFSGFHNMREFKQNGPGVHVNLAHQGDLSSWDFNNLTRLVILAHDRCIRVSVLAHGPYLAVRAYPRQGASVDLHMWKRHPTIEEAVANERAKWVSP